MIWANLLHLSFNMWEEAETRPPAKTPAETRRVLNLRRARPDLRFDDAVWTDLLERMVAAGMNMVVLDLGDGVRYASHPEIAVRGPGRRCDCAASWRGSAKWDWSRFRSSISPPVMIRGLGGIRAVCPRMFTTRFAAT